MSYSICIWSAHKVWQIGNLPIKQVNIWKVFEEGLLNTQKNLSQIFSKFCFVIMICTWVSDHGNIPHVNWLMKD